MLAEAIGWENALHVAAILSLVAALLWLGIRPQGEPPAMRDAVDDRTQASQRIG